MELIEGVILKYDPFNIWVQYVSIGDVKGCIVYDGEDQRYADTSELSPLALPIGLVALGFIEMRGNLNLQFPIVYRNGGMEIFEDGTGKFFIDGNEIKFTHEVQQKFDLFAMLPKKTLRSIAV